MSIRKAEKSPLPFNNLNALYAPLTHTNMGSRKTYWNTTFLQSLSSTPIPESPPVNSQLRAHILKQITPPKPAYYLIIPLLFAGGYQIGVNTTRHYALQFGFYDHYFGGH